MRHVGVRVVFVYRKSRALTGNPPEVSRTVTTTKWNTIFQKLVEEEGV